ncbi:MAG TPA: ACT domain-containing protein [Methanocorpusculum sp.]|nr:ACT domain-containing protein [Methanocorpusculum sp.]
MRLKKLKPVFSIGKLASLEGVDAGKPFVFTAATDEEVSLVCPKELMPADALAVSDGWRGFRITGVLDFSLTGILAKISAVLAEAEVGIFAVSTFNTDYIFVKEENFVRGISALETAGYEII